MRKKKTTLASVVKAAKDAQVSVSLKPRKRMTYYAVHWVTTNGTHHGTSGVAWAAAEMAVRAISSGANVIWIAKCKT